MSTYQTAYGNDINTYNSWYKSDKNNAHQEVMNVMRMIDDTQRYRQQLNIRNYRLYGDLTMSYGGSLMFSSFQRANNANRNVLQTPRVSLNVIKSCIDTSVSKLCKDKIKPTFLTSGGTWDQQLKAKELQKFVDGCFYEGNIYEVEQDMFLNTCIFGTGVLKVFSDVDAGKICYENVMPDEIRVDELDGYYGAPRSMYQMRYVDRQLLIALNKDKAEQIMNAPRISAGVVTSLADLILVVEAWRLPSTKGAKDGRHVICVDTATLLDEKWERDRFPFVFNRWTKMPTGFFGLGIPDEIVGIQVEINRLLYHIQESMRLLSAPKMLVQEGSNVKTQQMTNEIGSIYKYSGTPPQIIASNVISPDIFQQLQTLYQRAYEITGISQLSANSQKPSGLDSGKALRDFNDIQTERFVIQARKREQCYIDCAELTLLEARYLAEMGKDVEVRSFAKNTGMERINWEDIDAQPDSFVMQVFPSSALPSTPAFRLQTVQELIQGGLIEPEYALDLLDFPDLESFRSLKQGPFDNIMRVISNIVNKGKYQPPEPFTKLEIARPLAQNAYEKAQNDRVPEGRLALLRRYMEDLDALAQQALPPPPPPAAVAGPAGGPPPAGPLPTDVVAPGLGQAA